MCTYKKFLSTQHLDNHMRASSQVTKTEPRQVSARERVWYPLRHSDGSPTIAPPESHYGPSKWPSLSPQIFLERRRKQVAIFRFDLSRGRLGWWRDLIPGGGHTKTVPENVRTRPRVKLDTLERGPQLCVANDFHRRDQPSFTTSVDPRLSSPRFHSVRYPWSKDTSRLPARWIWFLEFLPLCPFVRSFVRSAEDTVRARTRGDHRHLVISMLGTGATRGGRRMPVAWYRARLFSWVSSIPDNRRSVEK